MKIQIVVAASLLAFSSLAQAFAQDSKSFPGTETFIRFNSEVSSNRQAEVLKHLGLTTLWKSNLVPGLVAAQPTSTELSTKSLTGLRQKLRNLPEILYAEPNFHIRRDLDPSSFKALPEFRWNESASAPNDPYFNRQWALSGSAGINPMEAWDALAASRTPTEVKVAVIDTGADSAHPDLQGRILPGHDFIDNTDNVKDTASHGTHVSGIIAAITGNGTGIAGIASYARIIPIRAVPDHGDETDLNVGKAFEFAVEQGARVANCSFGKDQQSQAVKDIIDAAGQKGLLVVVAAGNDSADNRNHPSFPVNFHTDNMIGVASIGSNGRLSYFSNYGPGIVDVAAPGGRILSTTPNANYESMDGTSMASPQVAGVAALVLSVVPTLTVEQLKRVLFSSVTTSSPLRDRVTTGGAINASAAVREALKLTNSN